MRLHPLFLLLLVTLLLALPGSAAAAPAVSGEFALGGATPGRLTVGADQNVWVVLTNGAGADDVARVTSDGTVTRFDVAGISNPVGITAGPDGELWVSMPGALGHFAPATPTAGTAVAVAALTAAKALVFGSDGNIWTSVADKVLRITTAGTATPFNVAGLDSRGITLGSDGNVYVADFSGRVIGVTPAGVATPYTTNPGMQEVLGGPGGQIAFTAPTSSPQRVGLLTPPAAATTTDAPPNGLDPTGIAFGLDGAYWMANFAGSTLTRYTPDGQLTILTGLSAGSGPRYITAGPGGTLWVSEEQGLKVARVSGLEAPAAPQAPTDPPVSPPGTTPPQAPDTTAPAISALLGPVKPRPGRTVRVKLVVSEAASLTVRVERRTRGRRSASGRCVAPTSRLRRARSCVRYVTVATTSRAALSGATALRVTAPRPLAPGRYRVVVTAVDAAGNRSPAARTTFAVLPRRDR